MHTIVVAKPGRLRDSLLLLLTTVPQIEGVDQVDDAPALFQQIRRSPPNLILMDSNLDKNGALETLQALKAELPRVPCLVIVSNTRQQTMALNAGADGMLLRGFSAAELAGAIRGVLSRTPQTRAAREATRA